MRPFSEVAPKVRRGSSGCRRWSYSPCRGAAGTGAVGFDVVGIPGEVALEAVFEVRRQSELDVKAFATVMRKQGLSSSSTEPERSEKQFCSGPFSYCMRERALYASIANSLDSVRE